MSTRSYAPNEKWEILLEALGSSRGPDEVCMRRGISLVELRRWLQLAREGALIRLSGGAMEGPGPAQATPQASPPAYAAPTSTYAAPPPGYAAPPPGNATPTSTYAAPPPAYVAPPAAGSGAPAQASPPAAGSGAPAQASPPAAGSGAPAQAAPPAASPISSTFVAPAGVSAAVAPAVTAFAPPPSSAAPPSTLAGPGAQAGTIQTYLEVITEGEAFPTRDEIDTMFSMVSHELKEPLRGVKAISQFMREDFAGLLPERGITYLETLQTTVDRMQRLVDGLSEFARCDQLVKEMGPVPLSPMIERVRNDLQAYLSLRHGSVVVDSRLPTVVGDPIALGRAFRHLIQNGLKFNTNPSPRVEVISTATAPGGSMCTILVRDNGIGIDARHFARIFELFQRLHRYDEHPGAGVGLTVARKIIQAHRGDISLESTPGQGTTFRITLPSGSGGC